MRIDGPKGLGSWLHGFFEGKFRGFLEGTASYAITASYLEGLDGHTEEIDQAIGELNDSLDETKDKLADVSGSLLETQRDFKDLSGSVARTQEDFTELSQSFSESFQDLEDLREGTFEQGTFEKLLVSGSQPFSPRLRVYGGVKIVGSLAQGQENVEAAGEWSHAEGSGTKALAAASHAEGKNTMALGVGSHAEGSGSRAIGINSHAEGLGTIAAGDYQTVVGRYNIPDASEEYTFIVGNGTSDENRSNAFAVKWTGEVEWDGDIIIRKKVALRWNFSEESLDIDFL